MSTTEEENNKPSESSSESPVPPAEKASEESPFKKPQFKAAETKSKPSQEIKPEKPPAPPSFTYEEPPWSALPPAEKKYHFEVIKEGSMIEPIDLSRRAFYIVGRLPDCHIPMQHPSLSRYHAVVQYSDPSKSRDPTLRSGWYVMDLGSANGTIVNKQKLESNQYKRLEIGHVVKFGLSTRLMILQGVQEADKVEEESSTRKANVGLAKQPAKPVVIDPKVAKSGTAAEGCMWGMSMDDEEVYKSAEHDPNFESSEGSSNESGGEEKARKKKPLDLSDPKKTLRVFFEREDLGMPDYQVENIGKNKHRAFVEIALEGRAIRVEGEGGNKKEAVAACAREACITLDKMDILRPRHKVSRKKETKKDWAANDYYDSDEDEYLDRTGDLEQKRLARMAREKAAENSSKTQTGTVHTEQSLRSDLEKLEAEIKEITEKLSDDERKRAEFNAARAGQSELDDLDAYMSALKQGVAMDATTRVKLKHRLMDAQKEKSRCERLLNIAKGPKLPSALLANVWPSNTPESQQSVAKSAPIVGKVPKIALMKFASNLPKLEAFDGDEESEEKSKMKKLDEFLEEDSSSQGEKSRDLVDDSSRAKRPKMDEDGHEHKQTEEPEDSGKVYGVFLPPELRQSLESHADEVDDIWDAEKQTKKILESSAFLDKKVNDN